MRLRVSMDLNPRHDPLLDEAAQRFHRDESFFIRGGTTAQRIDDCRREYTITTGIVVIGISANGGSGQNDLTADLSQFLHQSRGRRARTGASRPDVRGQSLAA